jgi:dihydrofolate reductase
LALCRRRRADRPDVRQCPKYVLTRGDEPLDWANSHRLGHIDEVAALKQGDGPDLLIQGSTTLYPELLARGLIDKLFLMTFPVVLGQGKRLLGPGTPAGAWKLLDHQVSSTRVAIASYEPAGAIPIGSFQMAQPSEAEQRRQGRMKREG